jgi:hypothetical protein
MTVTQQTPVNSYTANGVSTVFNFTFLLLASGDLDVYVDDVLKTLGADYSVSGLEVPAGGSVTFTTPPANGANVVLQRNSDIERATDYQNNGDMLAAVVNKDFDRLWLAMQEILYKYQLAPSLIPGSPLAGNVRLPDPEVGKYLRWNALENNLENADPGFYSGTVLPTGSIVNTFADLAITPATTAGMIVYIKQHTSGGVGGGYFQDTAGTITNNGGTLINNTVTSGRHWERINYIYFTSDMFGGLGDGSDETSIVQDALDAMEAPIYLLKISNGTKFNLASLTFPQNCNIEYQVNDDLSAPNPGGDIGSGERVYFSSNSSYPEDPTGAVVNEWRFTAPFHPGSCIDVRKSVSGGDAYLAPGQSRTNPARASMNIFDDQEGNWTKSVELYDTYSNFSGVKECTYRRTYTLNGIGTAQWSSVPTFGTLITGTTSGAKGFLMSVSAGATTVLWYSGKFVSGETVSDNNETTSATITTSVYSTTTTQPLTTGMVRGNWGIGLPPESNTRRPLLGVGGMIGVQKTRTFSQYIDETIDHPGYEWVDSYEAATPEGFQIVYDTTAAAAARRLTLRKYQTSTDIGFIGAVRACTGFTDAVLKADSSFNVTSITKNSTGDYTINFTNAFARADFMVSLTTSAALEYAYVFTKTTSFVRIRVVTTGTTTLVNLTGVLDVICAGGDI